MSAPVRALLILVALVAVVATAVWMRPVADRAVRQGDINLEAGFAELALGNYRDALDAEPDHLAASMGEAVSLMTLNRDEEALRAWSELIDRLGTAIDPDEVRSQALAVALANRGILQDRTGDLTAALADYRRALATDTTHLGETGAIQKIVRGETGISISERAQIIEKLILR